MARWLVFGIGACLAGVFFGGCVSTTGVGQARVLADGNSELTFGGELGVGLAKLSPGQPAPGPWLELGGGYRRGIYGFEAGVRAWGFGLPTRFFTFGGAADVKVPLLRAP